MQTHMRCQDGRCCDLTGPENNLVVLTISSSQIKVDERVMVRLYTCEQTPLVLLLKILFKIMSTF